MKEHKEEVEKMDNARVFTRGASQSAKETLHKSAITDHVMQNNHVIDWDSARIVEREADWVTRGMKEAIKIRSTANMNRDEGRYQLSHLYDDLLCPMSRD